MHATVRATLEGDEHRLARPVRLEDRRSERAGKRRTIAGEHKSIVASGTAAFRVSGDSLAERVEAGRPPAEGT